MDMEEYAKEVIKRFEAGKLKIHLSEEGEIIPEDKDMRWANKHCLNEVDAEKYRSAQAIALLRANSEWEWENDDLDSPGNLTIEMLLEYLK